MDEVIVVLGGIGAIVWVNWYFFLAEGRVGTATASGTGTQEATVVVQGGYEPSVVRVRAGSPVRLVFDRRETSSCSEEVVFPEFGVRRFLPAHEKTAVEIRPEEAGVYEFTCGMSMLRGKLIVEEGER